MHTVANEVSYKKSEIAIHQLKAAIKLFYDKDYVSALTLSGAASEIISSMCRARGLYWSLNFPAEYIGELKTKLPENLEKYYLKILNKTRNEIKHHDSYQDNIVEADFYFEAEMFILSSINNYKILFERFPDDKKITDFLKEFK